MAASARPVRRRLRQRFRQAMRAVTKVMRSPALLEARQAEGVVGERHVELDVEVAELGPLPLAALGHEDEVRRQAPAAERLLLVEAEGARQAALTVEVAFLDGQEVVGDQDLDARPAADD